MDKKGYVQIVGIVIFIVVAYFMIFVLIPKLTPPAELRISLQNNQIQRGQQGILFYKVKNSKNLPLENVIITNFIIGEEFSTKISTNIGRMVKGVE